MLYYLAITNSGDIEIDTVTVAETLVKVWYKIAFDFDIKFYISIGRILWNPADTEAYGNKNNNDEPLAKSSSLELFQNKVFDKL